MEEGIDIALWIIKKRCGTPLKKHWTTYILKSLCSGARWSSSTLRPEHSQGWKAPLFQDMISCSLSRVSIQVDQAIDYSSLCWLRCCVFQAQVYTNWHPNIQSWDTGEAFMRLLQLNAIRISRQGSQPSGNLSEGPLSVLLNVTSIIPHFREQFVDIAT